MAKVALAAHDSLPLPIFWLINSPGALEMTLESKERSSLERSLERLISKQGIGSLFIMGFLSGAGRVEDTNHAQIGLGFHPMPLMTV